MKKTDVPDLLFISVVLSVFIISVAGVVVKIATTPKNKTFLPKSFLFKHPKVRFQLNATGPIYDKYSPADGFSVFKNGEILTVFIGDKKKEVLLSSEYQRIGETNFFAKTTCL
jgi:hypothetical protein